MAYRQIDQLLLQVADALELRWAYVDSNLVYRKVSPQYYAWHGRPEGVFEGVSVKDALPDAIIERLTPYWDKVLSGQRTEFSTELVIPDRGKMVVDATYIPDECDGDVKGFFVFFRDHTQEVRTIETLRKLHGITSDNSVSFGEKIQQILELGRDTFMLPFAIVSEIHLPSNTYYVRYVTCPNNEIKVGDEFEFDRTYCTKTIAASGPIAYHHAATSDIASHPCYQQFQLESYIGIPIHVDDQLFGTLNFSSAQPQLNAFTIHDFDLMKLLGQWIGNELSLQQRDQALKHQKSLLESMSEQARIGVWELNLKTNQLYWSDMTKRIHGVTEDYLPSVEEAIGFYKEGESRDRISELVARCVDQGTPWTEELEIVNAHGKELWVRALGQGEFVDGECIRLFGSFQDIDEQVRNRQALKSAKEEAVSAARLKSEFLANMSHEIRTPMNGVLGMLNSLIKSPLDEHQLRYASLAKNSADSLLLLINDILDFSKVDAGKLHIESIDFHVGELLQDVMNFMSAHCEGKELVLRSDSSQLALPQVNGDPGRLRQILINLIGNAIKFTDTGQVVVTVESSQSEGHIHFVGRVTDTGIGIEAEKLNGLFDAFTQADSSTTRKFGGTGLGLAIVNKLCQLMGGQLTVASELGKGSEFTFTLQFQLPEHITETNFETEGDDQCAPFEQDYSVLLVEDNFINQEVAKELLSELSLTVDVADNGRYALEKLSNCSQPYDVVLMDCQMPEMDGYQATRKIREGVAGRIHSQTPIIALTANAMKGDREKCIEVGMNDYLSKPIDRVKLAKVLRQYLA